MVNKGGPYPEINRHEAGFRVWSSGHCAQFTMAPNEVYGDFNFSCAGMDIGKEFTYKMEFPDSTTLTSTVNGYSITRGIAKTYDFETLQISGAFDVEMVEITF